MGGTENAANAASAGSSVAGGASSAASVGSGAMDAFNAGNATQGLQATNLSPMDAASMGGSPSNIYGQMADLGGSSSPTASSFGPTVDNAMSTYGEVQEPSFMDSLMNKYEKFTNGMNQSIPEAYKNFGNNPETWGFGFGKATSMMKGGGQAPQSPVQPININYQQPENDYLKKYRKRSLYG